MHRPHQEGALRAHPGPPRVARQRQLRRQHGHRWCQRLHPLRPGDEPRWQRGPRDRRQVAGAHQEEVPRPGLRRPVPDGLRRGDRGLRRPQDRHEVWPRGRGGRERGAAGRPPAQRRRALPGGAGRRPRQGVRRPVPAGPPAPRVRPHGAERPGHRGAVGRAHPGPRLQGPQRRRAPGEHQVHQGRPWPHRRPELDGAVARV
mmetsp:Transcript_21950/g.57177  ORF Transcript_21950/g.57177 Transcript_21950/m.57177 type:complete len:202 (-) Transcript_21950:375-980(-)